MHSQTLRTIGPSLDENTSFLMFSIHICIYIYIISFGFEKLDLMIGIRFLVGIGRSGLMIGRFLDSLLVQSYDQNTDQAHEH